MITEFIYIVSSGFLFSSSLIRFRIQDQITPRNVVSGKLNLASGLHTIYTMAFFLKIAFSILLAIADDQQIKKHLNSKNLSCAQAKEYFEDYLATLPTQCKIDLDCRARFLHINTCARPYILHKYYIPEYDPKLGGLTRIAKRKCVEEIKNAQVCAPQVVNPICEQEKCKLPLWIPVKAELPEVK